MFRHRSYFAASMRLTRTNTQRKLSQNGEKPSTFGNYPDIRISVAHYPYGDFFNLESKILLLPMPKALQRYSICRLSVSTSTYGRTVKYVRKNFSAS